MRRHRSVFGFLLLFSLVAIGCGSAVSNNSNNSGGTGGGNLITPAAAARFLEQSTFGPTPTTISQVQQSGFPAFLNSQFALSGSTYADPAAGVTSLLSAQQTLFTNALSNSDQLRQRIALALSEIWVTSGLTVPPQGMAPYVRLLLQDAFANYRTLMLDVTLSPAMGRYLDMVNNNKPPAGQHANESYARELMQLFTLGLNEINEDGSLKLDSSGNLIPTYNQNQVEELALAFTGWTYRLNSDGTTDWIDPMVAVDSKHDMTCNSSSILSPAIRARATSNVLRPRSTPADSQAMVRPSVRAQEEICKQ